jgi:hypothetical protein
MTYMVTYVMCQTNLTLVYLLSSATVGGLEETS